MFNLDFELDTYSVCFHCNVSWLNLVTWHMGSCGRFLSTEDSVMWNIWTVGKL